MSGQGGLTENQTAEMGGVWSKVAGVNAGAVYANEAPAWLQSQSIAPIGTYRKISADGSQELPRILPNASAIYALASGVRTQNLSGALTVGLSAPSGAATSHAASSMVAFWPKALTNASTIVGGVGARLQLGPSQTLQIVSASANGATAVIASAGIASTLASGLYLGQPHTITMQVNGPRMDVWLATGALGASPILSASAVDALVPGWPAVQINAGSNVASGVVFADKLSAQSLAMGASDIGARETFRFESHPEGRVYQGNASVFTQDRLANYRGQFPKMPPVPSNSTATSAARVVVLQGEVDSIQGLDGPDITLEVLERNRFLRGG